MDQRAFLSAFLDIYFVSIHSVSLTLFVWPRAWWIHQGNVCLIVAFQNPEPIGKSFYQKVSLENILHVFQISHKIFPRLSSRKSRTWNNLTASENVSAVSSKFLYNRNRRRRTPIWKNTPEFQLFFTLNTQYLKTPQRLETFKRFL
jgi:hypothetical protein